MRIGAALRRVAVAFGLCAVAADPASAAPGVLQALLGGDGCTVAQFDGIVAGGRDQEAFLVLGACADRTMKMLLVQGHFPMRADAGAGGFHVLARIELPLPAQASADLANGACYRHGRVFEGTIGVIADWRNRQRVSPGKGLYDVIIPGRDRRSLTVSHETGIYCLKDSP